jgi:hypothetical protein
MIWAMRCVRTERMGMRANREAMAWRAGGSKFITFFLRVSKFITCQHQIHLAGAETPTAMGTTGMEYLRFLKCARASPSVTLYGEIKPISFICICCVIGSGGDRGWEEMEGCSPAIISWNIYVETLNAEHECMMQQFQEHLLSRRACQ